MGFTTEQKSEEKSSLQHSTNSIKANSRKSNISEFYSFLQELNYKTEIGLE